MKTTTDWFSSWFNTSYYHILYKDRDDTEAQLFMTNLTGHLSLKKTAHILDLPCGKGRHSLFLNSLGYEVTGADLSENSISFAKKYENDKLHFKVADMRVPFSRKYDAVFNLFTSFGYFEEDEIDIQILQNIKNGLKKDGVTVIDFLNVEKVKNNLVKKEVQKIDGIDFRIHRDIKEGFILKTISFYADNQQHSYLERVKYLDLQKMTLFMEKAGLKVIETFGNYHLEKFDVQTSHRLILVVK